MPLPLPLPFEKPPPQLPLAPWKQSGDLCPGFPHVLQMMDLPPPYTVLYGFVMLLVGFTRVLNDCILFYIVVCKLYIILYASIGVCVIAACICVIFIWSWLSVHMSLYYFTYLLYCVWCCVMFIFCYSMTLYLVFIFVMECYVIV